MKALATGLGLLAMLAATAPALAVDTVDVSIDSGSILNVFCSGAVKNSITINESFTPPKFIVIEGVNQNTIVAGPGCVKVAGLNRAECTKTGVTDARVFLLGGDDTLVNNTMLKSTTFGGSGADTIHSGKGDDVVHGEEGMDTIVDQGCRVDTAAFDNVLNGGDNNDTIRGALANACTDLISGDGGKDNMYGRGGNDRILSRDTVTGETVDCGGGVDSFQSDPGDLVAGDCETPLP